MAAMSFDSLPPSAAWHHVDSRKGFECAFFSEHPRGYRIRGQTAAIDGATAWAVRYEIALDHEWRTRSALVSRWSVEGECQLRVEGDGLGAWTVNDAQALVIDGCLDIDLESSACTNTLPVHRLRLGTGEGAEAPAAYIRASDLRVTRLEQRYLRIADDGPQQRYEYRAPEFEYEAVLLFDSSGLVLAYPGVATRAL
jgi:hypothetical protein